MLVNFFIFVGVPSLYANMKRYLIIPVILISVLFCPVAFGQSDDEELFRHWAKTIGSDGFGGRKPLTEYETKSIDYIASQMKELGLEPAFDGSYFQEVRLLSTTLQLKDNRIPVKGKNGRTALESPSDLVIWTSSDAPETNLKATGFVFCGFGIDAPEYGWDDFDGIDVRGKIVIAMVNDPGFYDTSLFRGKNMTYYGRWCCKFEEALRKGAVGCLVLHDTEAASYGWHVVVNGHTGSSFSLYNEGSPSLAFNGWISEDGCRKLFKVSGQDFDDAVAAAKKPGFKAFDLSAKGDFSMNVTAEVTVSHNVGGIMPGTDLKDEAVVFNAHWDHFGIGDPDENGDRIFNGAADNASGIAGVLLLAKKFRDSGTAPRRSLLFMSVTCEESGLFGSEWYCNHPVFSMEKTVTCINFDCIAPAPYSDSMIVLREGESFLDNWLVAAARAQGRHIDFNTDNSDGWFYRSDHFNFVKKGVKCVALGTTPKAGWYHKQNDEYSEDWDVSGALANIRLMFAVATMAATEE